MATEERVLFTPPQPAFPVKNVIVNVTFFAAAPETIDVVPC